MKKIIFLFLISFICHCVVFGQMPTSDRKIPTPQIRWQETKTAVILIASNLDAKDTFRIVSGKIIDAKVNDNVCALLLSTWSGYEYYLFKSNLQDKQPKDTTSWELTRFYSFPVALSGIHPPKIQLLKLNSISVIELKELETDAVYNVTIRKDGSFEKQK